MKGINGTLVYENEDVELLPSFIQRGYRTTPILYINGKKVSKLNSQKATPNQTLLSFLRDVMKLTGSKLGCAEGGCGACTVMISRYDVSLEKVIHYSVNACLMPVLAADGCHVTTVEGVGQVSLDLNDVSANDNTSDGNNGDDALHPIQKAMVDMHGSQCGYCTPGIIVAIYSLFANNTTTDYMEEHLDGNLCRCTGYRPIWDAARSLCTDHNVNDEIAATTGPCGTPCRECPERNSCEMECNTLDKEKALVELEEKKEEKTLPSSSNNSNCCSSSSSDKISNYKPTNNTKWLEKPNEMFPKELILSSTTKTSAISTQITKPLIVIDRIYHKAGTWFKPTTMNELLYLLKEYEGQCKIIVGNTEVGIETKFKHSVFPKLISPSTTITSLFDFSTTTITGDDDDDANNDADRLSIGSCCFTLTPTTTITDDDDTDADVDRLSIGSCVPLSMIQHECSKLLNDTTNNDFDRVVKPVHDMLRWFASTQIRNVACLGGNLATASPISDMNPMLACLNATLNIASYDNDGTNSNDSMSSIQRRVVPVRDFFLAYRKVDLKPYELIETIDIPKPRSVFEYVFPFKQAKRREDDISIVTSGMRIVVKPSKDKFIIEEMSIAFGGMAPRTVMAIETEKYLIGKAFCKETFVNARSVLLQEMDLPDDVPGGQAQFRKALTCSFLYKLYLMTSQAIQEDLNSIKQSPEIFAYDSDEPLPSVPYVDEKELSGCDSFVGEKKPSIQGTQVYPKPKVAEGLEKKYRDLNSLAAKNARNGSNAVGKAATHASGPLHCTGEALYTDDIPTPDSMLHASLIISTTCNAKFLSIDTEKAMKTPGVVAVYTHEDVEKLGGVNTIGFSPFGHDEYLFVPKGEVVAFVGQVIGICVAKTLESSETGARSVSVEYGESMGKPIVSIEDAIEAESFYDKAKHVMERTNSVEIADEDKVVKVSGTFRCGGQEHFYLETNSTLVVPTESATNLTIYCSTQAVNKTHMFSAAATNTHASKVVVRMKRMGGGFGGKETRTVPISCATAVAAKLINKPVRLTLSRADDMTITGGRHAFLAKYEASAVVKAGTKDVKLCSFNVELFNNGGSAGDLSGPVMDRALFHLDNCYYWPKFRAVGLPCKTAQAPHTAFRGFGGPQGLATCEHVLDHLAVECGVSLEKIRRDNMYKDSEATPFGMVMNKQIAGKWNVPTMWDKLYNELNISSRKEEINAFNAKHKLVKRGMAITPTKFGIAFTAKFMNQGGALVHLYTDGTVLVSHGGTEMGQGLHTKVCQVAAQAFGIPLTDVYINDTSSDKVANSIPTAASMSTDMYGMATLDACSQILKRIAPIRETLGPDATLREVASKAFYDRIDLSAHGFFAVDDSRCGYDWGKSKPDDFPSNEAENSWKGNPFNYFTQGVAYSEVEIDVLTGNHKTIRSDILVDVGCSINPALDIGQIEGAFIQGMGWCTMEEMIYGDSGHKWVRPGKTFTTGPGTYKIPAFNDVPETFNVSLMDNVDNPFAVHSSKAIGEPPFFLGCTVFFALKDAIQAARREKGIEGSFELRMPATSERIRMACLDDIAIDCITSGEKDESDRLSIAQKYQPKGSH